MTIISRRRALLGAALLALPAAARGAPCCGPVTPPGTALAAFLDGMQVERLWLAGWHVDWRSGERDRPMPGGPEAATHCSAFVAAVAERLGVYVLRPPEHPQELLANAQMAWLRGPGAARGWRALPDMRAAQAEANLGRLVLTAFQAPDPHRPGHIAVVRPSDKDAAALEREGPQLTQAGTRNAASITTAAGFRHHPGAWMPGGGGAIRYHAHDIAPGRLPG